MDFASFGWDHFYNLPIWDDWTNVYFPEVAGLWPFSNIFIFFFRWFNSVTFTVLFLVVQISCTIRKCVMELPKIFLPPKSALFIACPYLNTTNYLHWCLSHCWWKWSEKSECFHTSPSATGRERLLPPCFSDRDRLNNTMHPDDLIL